MIFVLNFERRYEKILIICEHLRFSNLESSINCRGKDSDKILFNRSNWIPSKGRCGNLTDLEAGSFNGANLAMANLPRAGMNSAAL